MSNPVSVYEWLNIRPRELRSLLLAMGSAFFLLSFMILTRSLRESLFLATYDIEKLPLMMGTVVIVSWPAVSRFSGFVSSHDPRKILSRLTIIILAGLVVLWKLLPITNLAINGIFIWTTVGSLLMASGFWLIVSDLFSLRGAKRLFSLISAGGTLGAMLTGASLSWLTPKIDLYWLVVLSVVPCFLFLVMVVLLPRPLVNSKPQGSGKDGIVLLEAARATWRNQHLRLMAGIIFSATLVMTLVDFQFKNLAQNHFSNGQDLAGFLGAFYGWASFVSLLFQVFLSGRLVEKRGVAFSLSLPASLLVAGSTGLLIFPSLAAVTALRGLDYSLRKSFFRPTMEVLYVVVPSKIRRLTKTFIDSIVDSSAEGFGVLIILLWITVLKLPASGLSLLVMIFAAVYFVLSRLINRNYLQTISGRLQDLESHPQQPGSKDLYLTGNLLKATFTNLDLSMLRNQDPSQEDGNESPSKTGFNESEDGVLEDLSSSDEHVVLRALANIDTLNPEHLEIVTRLVARDQLVKKVSELLQHFPQQSVPPLVGLLLSQETDFVIRRRIPEILASMGGEEADDALLDVLTDTRFEVRYRSAVALLARRKKGMPLSSRDWKILVWHAISLEVRKDRPLWELHRLLDSSEITDDDLISMKVGARGELSLEHTFRLLSLVLDPEQVRAAYHGVIFGDPVLKSFALEYLEMVLPRSVRERLWFYIGDVNEKKRKKETRSIDRVVEDMMNSGNTLFGGEISRQALDRIVAQRDSGPLSRKENQ